MKGVPRSTTITKEEFLQCLYEPEANTDKTFYKLNFLKKTQGMSLIKTKRRSLNSAYSKMRVLPDLRNCIAWDWKIFDFLTFSMARSFYDFEIERLKEYVRNSSEPLEGKFF